MASPTTEGSKSKTSSSQSPWKILKSIPQHISVEPMIFFLQAGFSVFTVLVVPGQIWKICEQEFWNDTSVDCRSRNMSASAENHVQQLAAMWNMIGPIVQFFPLLFIGPIYGAIGDRFGRKYNLLISLFGMMLMAVFQLLMYRFVMLPLWVGPPIAILLAFTGFLGTPFISAYAYVSDETKDPDLLTYRLTFLSLISNIASIIFGVVAAQILKTWSYYQAMFIPLGMWTLAFLYCLFFLHQVPPTKLASFLEEKRKRRNPKQIIPVATDTSINTAINDVPIMKESSESESEDTLKHMSCSEATNLLKEMVKSSIEAVTRKREGGKRMYIWFTVFAFFILMACGIGLFVVIGLFAMRSPISWTPSDLGYYSSYNSVLSMVGTLPGLLIMKRLLKLHETSMLIVALSFSTAGLIVTAFSVNGWMLYASSLFGVLGGLTVPVSKGLTVQFIERDEVGKIYSLFQIAQDFAIMFGYGGFNAVYGATVNFFPGTVFLIIAALNVVALIAIVFVHIGFKRHRKANECFQPITN